MLAATGAVLRGFGAQGSSHEQGEPGHLSKVCTARVFDELHRFIAWVTGTPGLGTAGIQKGWH